jgi:rubrerythrin
LTATQLAATAWVLEEGTIEFIEKLCHNILNDHEPALFDEVLEAKRAHQVTLSRVAREIRGLPESSDFPAGEIDLPGESLMVGCVKVSAALQWAADKRMNDLLELMMTLSANAYDFYLRLGRVTNSDEERRVFDVMANEEHQHLARLTKAYEKELSA